MISKEVNYRLDVCGNNIFTELSFDEQKNINGGLIGTIVIGVIITTAVIALWDFL